MKQPMQPIVRAKDDVIRFQENAIIRWLCDTGKIDLNALALMPFEDDDRMQLAQLLGYSVSGFGDLDYASKEVVTAADEIAASLPKR